MLIAGGDVMLVWQKAVHLIVGLFHDHKTRPKQAVKFTFVLAGSVPLKSTVILRNT